MTRHYVTSLNYMNKERLDKRTKKTYRTTIMRMIRFMIGGHFEKTQMNYIVVALKQF